MEAMQSTVTAAAMSQMAALGAPRSPAMSRLTRTKMTNMSPLTTDSAPRPAMSPARGRR